MSSSLDDGAAVTSAAASTGSCIPCSGLQESALLSLDQVKTELTTMPLWSLAPIAVPTQDNSHGGAVATTTTIAAAPPPTTSATTTTTPKGWCIRRYLVAKNFQAALDVIHAVGHIAERENHHPDLHVTQYRHVEIILFTHKLGGITPNDIQLAKCIDTEVTNIQYSPKWLREQQEQQQPQQQASPPS